jgi:hypothetical protein
MKNSKFKIFDFGYQYFFWYIFFRRPLTNDRWKSRFVTKTATGSPLRYCSQKSRRSTREYRIGRQKTHTPYTWVGSRHFPRSYYKNTRLVETTTWHVLLCQSGYFAFYSDHISQQIRIRVYVYETEYRFVWN